MLPLIGITVSIDPGLRLRPGRDYLYVSRAYSLALARAGALPVLVSPDADPDAVARQLAGVVITGGDDLPPQLDASEAAPPAALASRDAGGAGNRANPGPATDCPIQPEVPERVRSDRALLGALVAHDKPVLGICYGMQLMNLHFGGSLVMDVRAGSGELDHGGGAETTHHAVRLLGASPLWDGLGTKQEVNSCHRQAIDQLAPAAHVTARAADGVVEALQVGRCLGVQWHPETIPSGARLLANFVNLCRERSARAVATRS